MTVFMDGKQKRVQRPVMVEGVKPDEFIRQNADPMRLHQNELWELIEPRVAGELPAAWGRQRQVANRRHATIGDVRASVPKLRQNHTLAPTGAGASPSGEHSIK